MENKKLLMLGPIGSGKTTLCQWLAGLEREYSKTYSVELIGGSIDTPGEYIENRGLWYRLKVAAADAEMVLFVQDCVNLSNHFAPGHSAMFSCPVVGVITKIDLAPGPEAIAEAKTLLELAGANTCFPVSLLTGEGLDKLKEFIYA
ncbi:MAG: EutP/PduV family microcompartment system protein [Spirochaetaceae bacterium]|jgi:ethanolamine utilization protein EutP|nr:EutP/PduV family microcompartment system protein [Spirochaetaceae bacterium]